ncbi:BASS family bile acid:Na+ symporter [Roseimicrobium gellanilyticum]|uniref:BASS family bile acid:Na+ symporter n=1 Tax=Roseimicrobium gellanilyticum TaxID=748857 RepID=A0A366HLL7_9BACT|nr:bile acid:sodium symporter family protein [Roseimicrobium gellanilyticum]RBP42653.1 BASS family bile acid:Na+ symporter [Roseimicrobium gellanilyticum]
MPPDLLKSVLLPLALIILMFGMGMTLRLADFKRVVSSPKATLLGSFCQLVSLPLLAFGLAYIFKLPPDLATGLMLLAVCPGGATSNIITHLSKGDTALSVTLTAVSSIITVFTIPLLLGLSMQHFLGEAQVISLPFLKTFLQLLVVTLLPVALGMWLNAARPKLTERLSRTVNVLSVSFLALVILAAVLKEKDLGAQFAVAGPAAISLNICGMAVGYAVAAIFALPVSQRRTISIEVGIQNGTLALAIALGLLESPRMAIPAVVYSLFMFASGAYMILRHGREEQRSA